MDRTHTTSPTPAEHSLILCPSCSTLLSPPTSRVFRCANCGQSMTVGTRLPPTSMPPSRSPADFDVDFDARVRALLDTFQPGHPRYFVARNVLLHLPRTADNAIDVSRTRAPRFHMHLRNFHPPALEGGGVAAIYACIRPATTRGCGRSRGHSGTSCRPARACLSEARR